MNAIAPTRPIELQLRRVPLTAGPAAAAEARSQVRAAISTWDVPVDPNAAALLTSELVTNAITYEAGETVVLAITCSCCRLRVDVFDSSRSLPVLANAPADAETGRGLVLVATLSDDWGFYRTPAGKAVYFTLAFEPRGDRREDGEPHAPGDSPSSPNPGAVPAPRSPRTDGTQGGLAGDVDPRVDVQFLEDVRDVGRDGPS
jgi:anti-sigma regulatory factor (Ser/Thr protein kinase)